MFLLILVFIGAFSIKTDANNFLEKDLLAQLCNLQDSSVQTIKEDKCYLNADKILVENVQMFLNTDYFGPLMLCHLMQDSRGIYCGLYGYWRWNGCSWSYDYRPSSCENKDCDSTPFHWVESLPFD